MSVTIIEGDFTVSDAKIAIVVTRWNSFITERLKEGAIDTLKRHGIKEKQLTVVYCPGAYEIPLTVSSLLETGRYDGVVALGTVIRGATPHFDYVCSAVNSGVQHAVQTFNKPVGFGVLTTDTIDQAVERAGTKAGNKGEEAALATLEMVSLQRRIKQG